MNYYISAGKEHIRKEREKAYKLKKTRWWLDQLNQGVCHYCQKSFEKKELTMDHKIPLAKGGLSIKNNVVVSCKACNTSKKTDSSIDMILKKIF